MNVLDKKYHANRYIKENIPLLQEVFSEYYGPMWHDLVTDRLNNFAFIGYMTHIQMTNLIYNFKRNISNKYEIKFMEENVFDIEKKNRFFFYGFENFEKNPLNKIINRKENFENEVSDLFGLSSSDKDYQNKFASCLRLIDASKNSLYKYKEAYDEEIKEYQEYIDIDDRYEELFKNARADYIRHFLNKIYDILPQEDKNYYDNNEHEFYNDVTAPKYFRNMLIYKTAMLGRIDFTVEGFIENFSYENEEKLHSPLSSKDEKEYIMKDRIRYYNKMGINLGNDYQNYVNNEEAIKLTPKAEDVARIIKAKKEVKNEILRDFYSTIELFKENEETLLNSGLIRHNTFPYSLESYNENHWIVTCNVKELTDENDNFNTTNDSDVKLKSYPILLFNVGDMVPDQMLIHELNHIIEHKLADYDIYVEKNVRYINLFFESGFDFVSDDYRITKLGRRKYEMFNEIVNDIFAVEITDLMHKKGIYIFSEYLRSTKQEEPTTVYEFAKPLVKDFVSLYKEELKYAKLTGIKQELFMLIGEDNFNELNDLINEFYIYFGCADGDCKRIRETIKNIEEGKVTMDTRKYNNFIELSQVILKQMKNYKNTKRRKII